MDFPTYEGFYAQTDCHFSRCSNKACNTRKVYVVSCPKIKQSKTGVDDKNQGVGEIAILAHQGDLRSSQ